MKTFSLSFLLIALGSACSSSGGTNTEMPGSGGESSLPAASGGATAGATGGGPSGLTGGATGVGASDGSGGDTGLPPLQECDSPSVDRFQEIQTNNEGPALPASGSLLIPDGEGYKAEVEFTSDSAWHVFVLWLGNVFEYQVDLSASKDITITYSSTAPFYMQLRPASHWSGGDKWLVELPSTGGVEKTEVIPVSAASWTTLPTLGTPSYTFDEAIQEARGLVFVGNKKNTITITGLRIDGFTPECQ